MPIAAAIPALIGAAGTIGGSLLGAGGARSAGKTLANAGQNVGKAINSAAASGQQAVNSGITSADATLQDVVNQEKNNLNPYLGLGTQSTNTLAGLLGTPGQGLLSQFSFDPSQIASTPEYQFQLQQGTEAVQNSAAAKGGLFSGNTLRGLTQYSQGLASTSYQQAYNNALTSFQTNRNNTLGALLAGTGIGQTATGQFDAANQNFGNLVSQNSVQGQEFNANLGLQGAIQGGNAYLQGAGGYASGQVGQSNALGQGLAGLTAPGGPLQTLAGIAFPQTGTTGNIPGTGNIGQTVAGSGDTLAGTGIAGGIGIPGSIGAGVPDMAVPTAPSGTIYSGIPQFPQGATQQAGAPPQVYSQTLAALKGLQLAA